MFRGKQAPVADGSVDRCTRELRGLSTHRRQTNTSCRCRASSSTSEKSKGRIAGFAADKVYSNNVVESQSRRKIPTALAKPQHKRLKIAVDLDEVLGRFLYSLNKYCKEEFEVDYDLKDYKQYDFASVWGCSLDEANRRVHDFFESHYFALGILPIPGARPSLHRLKSICDLVVVTSRQHAIQEQTLEWLEKEFPGVFSEVHFGNHWALSGASRKKSEICREIGASVLIDDNPRYAIDCANAGIDVLLYDWELRYPWAKMNDGPSHPLIRRVQNWTEVEQQLQALALKQ